MAFGSTDSRTLDSSQKYCVGCASVLHHSARTCPTCGAPQTVQTTSPMLIVGEKNRIVAALLAIFLGHFGIHKFYLGRTMQGIVYLLFFWTLIPGFIGFIEGIVYLCTSDEKFAQKYG